MEEQFGVDLIYFNETFQSFVMVQYKAMEHEAGAKDIFRVPNEQLDKEIARMEFVSKELGKCRSQESSDGFRLNENPFFLKLCRRIVFNVDEGSQCDGMYLPLGYWKILSRDPRIKGPKGGMGVNYTNVGRYFDNGSFVSMVANAWIGSRPEQSTVLVEAIRSTVELGKAVVIAVKITKSEPAEQTESEGAFLSA